LRYCGYVVLDETRDAPFRQNDLDKIAAQIMGGELATGDVLKVVTPTEFLEIQSRVERGTATAQDKVKMAIGMYNRVYNVRLMNSAGVDIIKAFEFYLKNRSDLEKKLKTVHPNWIQYQDPIVLQDKAL
jgi:hypothetical protein